MAMTLPKYGGLEPVAFEPQKPELAPTEPVLPPGGMMERDISTEEWREYQMVVDGAGVFYRINKPLTLFVKRTERGDSHRVVDADGITHYIPVGWIAIRWKATPPVSL